MKLRASDLSKQASSADVIYDALRDAIIRGEVGEGEALRQDTIAQMFRVSRIPVREAMQRLEAQGLVVSERHKGAVVASLSVEQITEIFQFRALIEPIVIELAVPLMSEETLAEAQRHCDAFAAETDPLRWGDLNRAFHRALYKDSDKPYFLSVIDKTNDLVERYVRLVLYFVQGMRHAIDEHQAILDACKARDAATAGQLTRKHIEIAGEKLVAYLKSQKP
ncbi:transcriptional regulator [Pannonibacter phragmitetus]|uniref:Transcriptional regulator n=1 Tax=Pannonibacter phragmitetus TaxID=121719 RepID=A0A0L0IY81_9HYPH|nr:transcriptional regulator [Pannonibacter phragmitetus]KND18239.1 transcriptional regulator [Pannonibacter phragmitetus]MBA4205676.1 pyruvate dehydrogenase complex transcriptional repressor PdhR [Polymorphum sp.]